MADIRPFRCIRPTREAASAVAALPYDVYDREEAKEQTKKNSRSFLMIDRAETQFDDSVDAYDPRVYERARQTLLDWQRDGILEEDAVPCFYLYELTMAGRSQTGLVACTAVDDYLNGVIKKHENTREDKELDRIRHVDITNAHTGPIFLAYRADGDVHRAVRQIKAEEPLFAFISEDGIGHRVWRIADPDRISFLRQRFSDRPLYIADGHHRAASAVKVGLKRRAENPGYTGEEPFNYFLSVLFPDDELKILPYNRFVRDLNGMTGAEFISRVEEHFVVERLGAAGFTPDAPHTFGLYLGGSWYRLAAKPELITDDPVKGLDASILQDYLLAPVLGIADPRTDERIRFVGGIRGLAELERLVKDSGGGAAFSLYPTSVAQLFAVADAGLLMPPKSTWFEPKLRSGLFIHSLGVRG